MNGRVVEVNGVESAHSIIGEVVQRSHTSLMLANAT